MDEMGPSDPEMSRDPDEEETGFMDDSDNMYETSGGAKMPDGLDEGNLAFNDYHDWVVAGFTAERSKYSRPGNLEFRVAKSGKLWVK